MLPYYLSCVYVEAFANKKLSLDNNDQKKKSFIHDKTKSQVTQTV
jgi:hypothetical protein